MFLSVFGIRPPFQLEITLLIMAFAIILKAGRPNQYEKPPSLCLNISKAYLETSEPLKDGETVTLRIYNRHFPEGVICARFSNKKDGVSLNLVLPSRKQYALFVDDHPTARVHLTGSYVVEPTIVPAIIETAPN